MIPGLLKKPRHIMLYFDLNLCTAINSFTYIGSFHTDSRVMTPEQNWNKSLLGLSGPWLWRCTGSKCPVSSDCFLYVLTTLIVLSFFMCRLCWCADCLLYALIKVCLRDLQPPHEDESTQRQEQQLEITLGCWKFIKQRLKSFKSPDT